MEGGREEKRKREKDFCRVAMVNFDVCFWLFSLHVWQTLSALSVCVRGSVYVVMGQANMTSLPSIIPLENLLGKALSDSFWMP